MSDYTNMIRIQLFIGDRVYQFDGSIKEGRKWLMQRMIDNAEFAQRYGDFRIKFYVVE